MTPEEIKQIMSANTVYRYIGNKNQLKEDMNGVEYRTCNIQGTLYFTVVVPEEYTPSNDKMELV